MSTGFRGKLNFAERDPKDCKDAKDIKDTKESEIFWWPAALPHRVKNLLTSFAAVR